MSEQQDYIVVTIESDSDDNSSHDHNEVMLLQDSTSEASSDLPSTGTSSDESSVIQPDFQDYNYQQQFQLASGEGTSQSDQAVPQVNLETLKRPNSNSVGFIPPTKRGRQSAELEDRMALLQLIEKLNGQINQLFGMISKLHQFWENSSMQKCGHCCRLLQNEMMATHEPDGSIEAFLQSVLPHEQQQQQPQQQQSIPNLNSFLPRIISTNSLTSDDSVPDVPTVPDILDDDDESNNIVISDAQPTIEAPEAFLLPQDPSLAGDHNFINYSAIVENEHTTVNTSLPRFLVPSNFEMPENEEMDIPDDTVMWNAPNLENDEVHSTNLPCVFSDNVGVPEASLENNFEPVNFPLVMGNDNDYHSSTDSLPPDSVWAKSVTVGSYDESTFHIKKLETLL
ncbi:uncharacterized protein RHO17_003236 [Thomomys bottae]